MSMKEWEGRAASFSSLLCTTARIRTSNRRRQPPTARSRHSGCGTSGGYRVAVVHAGVSVKVWVGFGRRRRRCGASEGEMQHGGGEDLS